MPTNSISELDILTAEHFIEQVEDKEQKTKLQIVNQAIFAMQVSLPISIQSVLQRVPCDSVNGIGIDAYIKNHKAFKDLEKEKKALEKEKDEILAKTAE